MSMTELAESGKRGRLAPENGPFVLRSLLQDVPLSTEGDDVHINCVEFLETNLYVGTSASEILHFFQIPPDPADTSGKPSYILATRLSPAYTEPATRERPGVQQILLLPTISKACVLCNWSVTFYSLPELSPIFSKVSSTLWIGGIDQNGNQERSGQNTVTILLSSNKRITVVRVGEEPRLVKHIDFAGSTISVRRDAFACVADSRSYALLDVDRQLKIPLFPISSLDVSQPGTIGGQAEDISSSGNQVQRSTSSAQRGGPTADDRGHTRSTSLGNFIGGSSRRQGQGGDNKDQTGRETPDPLFRESSPAPSTSPTKPPPRQQGRESSPRVENKPPPPPPPSSEASAQDRTIANAPILLKPHIVSPSPQEFLLVTGTGPSDPGLGIFVNLEGEVTRSTLEFDKYPDALVADGRGFGTDFTPNNAEDEEEGFVLAAMSRGENEYGLEIQRWDIDQGEGDTQKYWLPVTVQQDNTETQSLKLGLRSVTDPGDINFDEVVEKLRVKRFNPSGPKSHASTLSLQSSDSRTATSVERVSRERELFESQESLGDEPLPAEWEENRNAEELQFARRLGQYKSKIAVWSRSHIWWVVRTPLALRLDEDLEAAGIDVDEVQSTSANRTKIIETINTLRGREAKTETEFMSLGYIRQRAGLLLFISLISSDKMPTETEYRGAEEALSEGGLDPRVVISLIPELRIEVVEGRNGIWIPGGVKDTADTYISERTVLEADEGVKTADHVLQFFRRFLATWRRKKGFGSIANDTEVFRTVDAALLRVLLQLDKSSPRGPARAKSIRSELNDLVDHGLDCFERAVALLELNRRLFILSRLYQSRKMSGEVLSTWRRILEGEVDEGGEFIDGEQRVKEYLMNIRNAALVEEYGAWLAARNPLLGVQIFTEERSRVKFEPKEVVGILKRGAPNAVKEYLEHLVFGKDHTEYVNDLIAYYLDIVIHKLETSDDARDILIQSYETYRALRPPKPTYRQFITENAIEDEWWQSRLRLLQLLGGSHGSASEYDVTAILVRIEPFRDELVPEVIILDGRQSRHQEAIKLLTHGLGDYDTAINYCLLGGSSIYHHISGTISQETLPSRDEQAKLFGYLLAEFLHIVDVSDRIEQTSGLLERFAGWFDVSYVIGLIPDTWSVELVSGFLMNALRRIVREKHETTIAKALSGAENLKISADMINKIKEIGPSIEALE